LGFLPLPELCLLVISEFLVELLFLYFEFLVEFFTPVFVVLNVVGVFFDHGSIGFFPLKVIDEFLFLFFGLLFPIFGDEFGDLGGSGVLHLFFVGVVLGLEEPDVGAGGGLVALLDSIIHLQDLVPLLVPDLGGLLVVLLLAVGEAFPFLGDLFTEVVPVHVSLLSLLAAPLQEEPHVGVHRLVGLVNVRLSAEGGAEVAFVLLVAVLVGCH
jgi:hypothetical protein